MNCQFVPVPFKTSSAGALPLAPDDPGGRQRGVRRLQTLIARWLTERRLRAALIVALGGLGVLAISDLAVIVTIAADLTDDSTSHVVDVANGFARIEIQDTRGVILLLVRAGLDVLVGVAMVTEAVLLARGKARRALELATPACCSP